MTLIPESELAQLRANGRAQRAAIDNGEGALDFNLVVKLSTADRECIWLLTEQEPGHGLYFGLCDLGLRSPELTYVAMAELRSFHGKRGLLLERDDHFDANKTISAYAEEARKHGRIVA